MLSKEVIDVKDTEMGKREHVIFSVTVGGAEKKNAMPPPTFVAQTKRQAEGQIVKTVSRLPLLKICLYLAIVKDYVHSQLTRKARGSRNPSVYLNLLFRDRKGAYCSL